jgi:ABC-type glycerol-3-phosphate transport system permease component
MKATKSGSIPGTGAINKLPTKIVITMVFAVIAASMLYPMYITIITAFKPLAEYRKSNTAWPSEWTFVNFTQAWSRAHMDRYTLNSVIVTVLCLILITVVVTPAGFAFAKLRFPAKRLFLGLIIAMVVISPGLQIVPVFKMVNAYGLISSHIGLAIVLVAFHLTFGIYLMSSYFEGVPSEVFEAARIDGAGIYGTFFRIAMPLAKPGLLTLLTFSFLGFWNEYIYSFILLLDPDKRTLPVGVAGLIGVTYTSQPLVGAGTVIAMVPCLLVFLILQRNLQEGLTMGVSK